jgi:hypothetical protein
MAHDADVATTFPGAADARHWLALLSACDSRRGDHHVTGVLADFHRAWRGMRRAPGFSAIAAGTLALGIAAATTVFALVDGVLLKPIGGVRLDDVFVLSLTDQRNQDRVLREADFRELAGNHPAEVSAMSGTSDWLRTIARIPGRADEVAFQGLSGEAADVLGLRAQLGRWIVPADDRAQGTDDRTSHYAWPRISRLRCRRGGARGGPQ